MRCKVHIQIQEIYIEILNIIDKSLIEKFY